MKKVDGASQYEESASKLISGKRTNRLIFFTQGVAYYTNLVEDQTVMTPYIDHWTKYHLIGHCYKENQKLEHSHKVPRARQIPRSCSYKIFIVRPKSNSDLPEFPAEICNRDCWANFGVWRLGRRRWKLAYEPELALRTLDQTTLNQNRAGVLCWDL